MNKELMEEIYMTLQGSYTYAGGVQGVENLFEEDACCMKLYAQVYDANQRLCERLGVVDEDDDVEIIISNMMDIERIVSMKMFEYGWKFALQQQMSKGSGGQ